MVVVSQLAELTRYLNSVSICLRFFTSLFPVSEDGISGMNHDLQVEYIRQRHNTCYYRLPQNRFYDDDDNQTPPEHEGEKISAVRLAQVDCRWFFPRILKCVPMFPYFLFHFFDSHLINCSIKTIFIVPPWICARVYSLNNFFILHLSVYSIFMCTRVWFILQHNVVYSSWISFKWCP